MHRQAREELAEAARRRLELLGRELDQAGLRRVGEEPPDELATGGDPAEELPAPRQVRPVGRHSRAPRPRVTAASRVGAAAQRVLPDTFRGRVALTPGAGLLVLGLVTVSLAVTAFVVLRTGADRPGVPGASGVPAVGAVVTAGGEPLVPAATPAPTSVPGATRTAGGGRVTVDVAGRVRRPGVTTLPEGSRVVDALEKAGGPRGRVDLTSLNLARVLVDGEQILVGRPTRPGNLAAGASTVAPDATSALVNLNTATAAQLDTLPGVGPVTAAKILDWRVANGAFASIDELLEVDGIGEKTLAEIAPHVTV